MAPSRRRAIVAGLSALAGLAAVGVVQRVLERKAAAQDARLGDPSPHWVDGVHAGAVAPDGRRLALIRAGGRMEVWNLETSKRERVLFSPQKEREGPGEVVFLTGGRIAAAGFGFGLRVMAVDEDKVLWRTPTPRDALAASADGRMLAIAADFDGTFELREAETGKAVRTMKGHVQAVLSIAFSPDGRALYTTSRDLTVRKWDVAAGRELWRRGEPSRDRAIGPTFPQHVAVSPDGRWVAVTYHGCWATGLEILEAAKGALVSAAPVEHSDALAFTGKGNLLAYQGKGGNVHLWDPEGKRLKARSSEPHKGRAFMIAPFAGGEKLVSAGEDGDLRIWEVARFEEP